MRDRSANIPESGTKRGRDVRHLKLAPTGMASTSSMLSSRAAGCINRPPGLVSPPRLHLWEDPAGEAPLADDNKVSCCSTI